MAALAKTYGPELDEIALARSIYSENRGGSSEEMLALAGAMVNNCARRKKTIGQVGFPWRRQGVMGSRWSTARPESDEQLPADLRALAVRVLAGERHPLVPTAHTFFEPALQDIMRRRNPKLYHYDAAELDAKWTAEGLRFVGVVGRWRFYA